MGLNEKRAFLCDGKARGKCDAHDCEEERGGREGTNIIEDGDEELQRLSPDMIGQKRPSNARDTLVLFERPCEKKLKREEACPTINTTDNKGNSCGGPGSPSTTRGGSRELNASPVTPRMLSPLDIASAEELRQHIRDVRREVFLRPMLAIVSRLMFHRANHGLFNVRVDPVVWNIPHYFEIVKHPMDLALVKNKCLNLEYATADDCAADIRLVFTNACLFNPPGHVVHESAILMLKDFDAEYTRFQSKSQALAKRRDEHSCPFCLANVCGICQEKCINFEPPFVMCSGPCQQRIKRHSVYYKTPDRTHHWCTKCFSSLPKVLLLKNSVNPSGLDSTVEPTQTISKSCLLKAKFLDELTEPWVQCDRCCGWVHQICALFNACENADDDEDIPYTCPLCRLKDVSTENEEWDIVASPSGTSVDEFPVNLASEKYGVIRSHSPVLKQKPASKDFTRVLGFDTEIEEKVFGFLDESERKNYRNAGTSAVEGYIKSDNLRTSALSQFMQNWVRRHLNNLGEHETAQSIVIKVVSSIKSSCVVSPVVREHFRSSGREYPPAIDFTSKAIFVFQKINGIEVCIFSMYIQEYDSATNFAENRNRTYIAYIDSLVYMRPRHIRTSLFHEILISYLAFSKANGFEYAHIWACPTTRGGDFIYWCHPSFQKNPGKDRLLQWYLSMADKGKKAGVVFACQDLYSCEFENMEAKLDDHLPPYFDGDYWPTEVERLAAVPPKRGKLSKEAYEESLRGQKFRKRLIDSVKASKESLFVISLQPSCSVCQKMVVNTPCWKSMGVNKAEEYVCSSCRDMKSLDNEPVVEVLPPDFIQAGSDSQDNEDTDTEISCPFLDHRPDMLKNCEEYHYQFDSYRRAKYSTMMLIYQIYSTQVGERVR